MAHKRAEAKQRYADALHQVQIRGPEGKQIHKDAKGNRVKGGGQIIYQGFFDYLDSLEVVAGEMDPDLKKAMKEIKQSRRFWAGTPEGELVVVKKDAE